MRALFFSTGLFEVGTNSFTGSYIICECFIVVTITFGLDNV